MHSGSDQRFKNRVRVRVCGILIENGHILLVQMHSPVTDSLVWLPPGGELEFGETLDTCLQREFKEETGLNIKRNSWAFLNEFVNPPFHAVELYYFVTRKGGVAKLGRDPELAEHNQLLKDLRWISLNNLAEFDYFPDKLCLLKKAPDEKL